MKKKKCSPRKLRRKNPAKRRKNPAITCPSCGAGNKDGKDTCWKCHFELKPSAGKPHFGRSLRSRAPMKRRKKSNKRRHMKRQKRRGKR